MHDICRKPGLAICACDSLPSTNAHMAAFLMQQLQTGLAWAVWQAVTSTVFR